MWTLKESALPGAVIEFPLQPPPANSGTLKFVLSHVVVEGPEILPPVTLRTLYAEMIGQEVTYSDTATANTSNLKRRGDRHN